MQTGTGRAFSISYRTAALLVNAADRPDPPPATPSLTVTASPNNPSTGGAITFTSSASSTGATSLEYQWISTDPNNNNWRAGTSSITATGHVGGRDYAVAVRGRNAEGTSSWRIAFFSQTGTGRAFARSYSTHATLPDIDDLR